MKLLQVHTFYHPYLNFLYESNSGLSEQSYEEQNEKLIYDGFSGSHMIAPHLKSIGYDAWLVIANALPAQMRWMKENGIPLQNKDNAVYEIVFRQIEKFKPDVLYLSDPITFDSRFVKILPYKPKLVLGWRAASIPPQSDFTEFDLMLSNHRESIEEAVKRGVKATERFSPGMPSFIMETTKATPKNFDIVFSGQVSEEHKKRRALLETIVKLCEINPQIKLGLFIPEMHGPIPESLRKYNFGARWGMDMYKALASGKIVFNAHIDLVSNEAANMRMFETTAVGSLLLTERYDNINTFFEPDKEIGVYGDEKEMIEKIAYYLENQEILQTIAENGQKRCMRDHSMVNRISIYEAIIRKYLNKPAKSEVFASPKPTNEEFTLKGTLQEIINKLSTDLQKYPRREAGKLLIDGKKIHYADLHSFYHQIVQIFGQNLYTFESTTQNPRILDCGAHIGIASLFFGTKYPNAKITAFEADPEIANMAANNLNSFNIPDYEVIPKAVWKDNKGVSFEASNDDSGFVDVNNISANKVPSVRLRDYLEQEKVELLKIDIEGAEYEVLKDCRGVLRNVNRIVAEIHRFRAADGKFGELLSLFEEEGFFYTLGDFHPAEWLGSEQKSPFTSVNTDKFIITIYAWKNPDFKPIEKKESIVEVKKDIKQTGFPENLKHISELRMLNLGYNKPQNQDWKVFDILAGGKPRFLEVINRGIPTEDDSFNVIYQSHLIEHFPRHNVGFFLDECHRILRPGGVLRLVVPDLERIAEEYLKNLRLAAEGDPIAKERYDWIMLEMFDQTVRNFGGGEMLQFWAQDPIPARDYIIERIGSEVEPFLNMIKQNPQIAKNVNKDVSDPKEIGEFRLSGEVHYWMYDRHSLTELLKTAGFENIYLTDAAHSGIPNWKEYKFDVDQHGVEKKPDSLYIEAWK
ncbi:MAG: hypothetical protein SCALA702_20290 [Melioribacteraceae bacterium]|nr:MAG: hypothetical protein SCALA702_20290 [Melioribacteraceae bacterium]